MGLLWGMRDLVIYWGEEDKFWGFFGFCLSFIGFMKDFMRGFSLSFVFHLAYEGQYAAILASVCPSLGL